MSGEPERPGPSFGELIAQNARLLALVLALAALAWLFWRGLVWMFPDVVWLRPRA